MPQHCRATSRTKAERLVEISSTSRTKACRSTIELKHAAALAERYTQAKHVTEVKRTGVELDARPAAELRASSQHISGHTCTYVSSYYDTCVLIYCLYVSPTQALSSTLNAAQSCERVRDTLKTRRKRKRRIRRARIRMRPVRIRQVRIRRARTTQRSILRRKSKSTLSMKKASTRQSVSIGSFATSRLWYNMF